MLDLIIILISPQHRKTYFLGFLGPFIGLLFVIDLELQGNQVLITWIPDTN